MFDGKPVKKQYTIALIAAVLVTAGYVFYRVKKHDFLSYQLQTMVEDKSNHLYKIEYDSIAVNELAGDVYIRNIHIKGDTSVQKQMINNGDTNATAMLLDIFIPILKVEHFKTAGALLSKQLECEQITIKDPIVHAYLFPGQAKPKDPRQQQQALYKQILGNFRLIKANNVSIENGNVTAADFFSKQLKFQTFGTSVSLSQLAIDSTYNLDTTRTLFCKYIGVASDKLFLGEKNKAAEITGISFNTDTKILAVSSFHYDAFKSNGSFKSKLEGISIEGVKWTGPIENTEVVIDKAVIKKGEIETLTKGEIENNGGKQKDPTILTGWIKTFSMNALTVRSVNFISRTRDVKNPPLIVRNNSFSVKNIHLTRASKFDATLAGQAKEIELTNDEITIKSADKLYEYKVAGIKLNTRTRSLDIGSVTIKPQLTEAAFAAKAHYQTDRYDVKFNKISCTDINIQKLINGEVELDRVATANSSIKVFRDLSYPLDTISKHGHQESYPHQIIHQLGFPIKINRFISTGTYIEYKEKNAKSNNSGRVRFTNSYVSINNISTLRASAGEKTVAVFRTSFLETIPITGSFTFFLNDWQKGVFTVEATIDKSVDATVLNQLTEPMSLVRLDKGVITSVKFYMKADTNTSNGTLVLPYHDMKISLLKKKGQQYAKKGITSIFANAIVKNNNIEGPGMRTAKITLNRNKYRSFFNFIWSTALRGIKEIALFKLQSP